MALPILQKRVLQIKSGRLVMVVVMEAMPPLPALPLRLSYMPKRLTM